MKWRLGSKKTMSAKVSDEMTYRASTNLLCEKLLALYSNNRVCALLNVCMLKDLLAVCHELLDNGVLIAHKRNAQVV